jgi:hypothetical protein
VIVGGSLIFSSYCANSMIVLYQPYRNSMDKSKCSMHVTRPLLLSAHDIGVLLSALVVL